MLKIAETMTTTVSIVAAAFLRDFFPHVAMIIGENIQNQQH